MRCAKVVIIISEDLRLSKVREMIFRKIFRLSKIPERSRIEQGNHRRYRDLRLAVIDSSQFLKARGKKEEK